FPFCSLSLPFFFSSPTSFDLSILIFVDFTLYHLLGFATLHPLFPTRSGRAPFSLSFSPSLFLFCVCVSCVFCFCFFCSTRLCLFFSLLLILLLLPPSFLSITSSCFGPSPGDLSRGSTGSDQEAQPPPPPPFLTHSPTHSLTLSLLFCFFPGLSLSFLFSFFSL